MPHSCSFPAPSPLHPRLLPYSIPALSTLLPFQSPTMPHPHLIPTPSPLHLFSSYPCAPSQPRSGCSGQAGESWGCGAGWSRVARQRGAPELVWLAAAGDWAPWGPQRSAHLGDAGKQCEPCSALSIRATPCLSMHCPLQHCTAQSPNLQFSHGSPLPMRCTRTAWVPTAQPLCVSTALHALHAGQEHTGACARSMSTIPSSQGTAHAWHTEQVPAQTTAASSRCWQSVMPHGAAGHCSKVDSFPWHRTLSSQMGPVPSPKNAPRGAASAAPQPSS